MNYKFDSIVNKTEAAALKDMIFKRAAERAQLLNEDVQSDVMDLARDSFVSDNNPFSRIIKDNVKQEPVPETTTQEVHQNEEIGFPVREPKNLELKQNKVVNDQISSAVIQNNMLEARNTLSNKQSFMGALNFLNSQAAISLIKTRADKFEMVV